MGWDLAGDGRLWELRLVGWEGGWAGETRGEGLMRAGVSSG